MDRIPSLSGVKRIHPNSKVYPPKKKAKTQTPPQFKADFIRTGTSFIIRIDLPGMVLDRDFTVSIVEEKVQIQGERKTAPDIPVTFIQQEREFGKFFFEYPIHENADPKTMEKTFSNGVLVMKFSLKEKENYQWRTLDVVQL